MSARDYLPWMSASEPSPAERASEEQAPSSDLASSAPLHLATRRRSTPAAATW
ncbi:MAG: hypothetical protein IPJ56_04310 [Gemmatimonadetes bacterium]|nr:hypothetical protein [Gemmatimonadota bacterium]